MIRSQYFLGFAAYQTGIALRTVGRDRAALQAFGRALPLLRNVGFRNEVATTLEQIARLLMNDEPARGHLVRRGHRAPRSDRAAGIASERRSKERALLGYATFVGSNGFASPRGPLDSRCHSTKPST